MESVSEQLAPNKPICLILSFQILVKSKATALSDVIKDASQKLAMLKQFSTHPHLPNCSCKTLYRIFKMDNLKHMRWSGASCEFRLQYV